MIINVIGETCPIPVIKTKNGLKEIEEGDVEVIIDNVISKENIEKFALQMNYPFKTVEKDGVFHIYITKIKDNLNHQQNEENIVIVIDSDKMGDGEDELGITLMKGFIYTLTELETLPKTIIFYNKGVLLTSKTPECINNLKKLEEVGVEILSCGACANYYHVENEIKVGTITNMYTIVDRQMNATKVIKP